MESKIRKSLSKQTDGNRREIKSGPKVTYEVGSVSRRAGDGAFDYWRRVPTNSIIYRPVRRMTIEEAFPSLHHNAYYSQTGKVIPVVRTTNHIVDTRYYSNGGVPHLRQVSSAGANPRAKREVIAAHPKSANITKSGQKETVNNKTIKTISAQNGSVGTSIVNGSGTKVNTSAIQNPPRPNYREIRMLPSNKGQPPNPGSASRESDTMQRKFGTFKIPRPQAYVQGNKNGSVSGNVKLIASKKRAVRFGGDEVYEYTPLDPLQNYPIHEEIL